METANIKKTLEDFAKFLGEQEKALKTSLTANIGTAKTEAVDAAGLGGRCKNQHR